MKRYGVHVNGYTVGADGEVSMWLARRSATKQTYPGLLDNVVRGAENRQPLSSGVTLGQQVMFVNREVVKYSGGG